VFISTSRDAQQHLETRIKPDCADFFSFVANILTYFDMLFVDFNKVSESRIAYYKLIIKESEFFASFCTKFLQLASKSNVPKKDWKNDLFRKFTVGLQTSLLLVKSILKSF
jgi:hypothetical protein